VHVDRHHAVELGQRDLFQTRTQRDAGIVDQPVDAPIALAQPFREL
jgi:hypothetical protein